MTEELSLAGYIDLDKKIDSRKAALKGGVRIAIAGSFTLNGFKEALNVKCHETGLGASFYVDGYNNYVQALADKKSGLYRFGPDVTFLIIDARSLLGGAYLEPYSITAVARKRLSRDVYGKIESLVDVFMKHGRGILVINNMEVPWNSPAGILEKKEGFGYFEMVGEINRLMNHGIAKRKGVYLFDYDSFASGLGKRNVVDRKMLYIADMKVSPDIIPALCDEYMRYIRAFKGLSKKCLVLDMDNTLWGGILGEDGFEGIRLGPTPPGNAYMEFQSRLAALYDRGIILAVNSSNNKDDCLKVLREHPYMILKEKHFASIRINWESKVKNMVDIAREINIGFDGIIFLDDDKRVRQIVKRALPEVVCPDLPEDHSLYASFLEGLKGLDSLQITAEDRTRGRQYAEERKRSETKAVFRDLSVYLEHLRTVALIKKADRFSIPRISQLTIRTNQFNLSGERLDEKAVEGLANDKRRLVYSVSIGDRYGDYGITGAVIINREKEDWVISSFLLSCRVLGKDVEYAILSSIIKMAKKEGVERVLLRFVKTEKNVPALRFLRLNGVPVPEHKAAVYPVIYSYGKSAFPNKIRHVKVVSA